MQDTQQDIQIPVSSPAHIVQAYIALIYVSCLPADLVIADLLSLLNLSDRMQSRSFFPFIFAQITDRAAEEPWEAFIYASQRQDVALGMKAIEAFASGDLDCPATHFPVLQQSDLVGVKTSWLIELMRLKYGVNGGHMTRSRGRRDEGEYRFSARDIGTKAMRLGKGRVAAEGTKRKKGNEEGSGYFRRHGKEYAREASWEDVVRNFSPGIDVDEDH